MKQNFTLFDTEYISKQVNENHPDWEVGDTVLHQMQETMEQSNKENTEMTKRQNRISNWVQILTLITAVLTLLATVWFGIRG